MNNQLTEVVIRLITSMIEDLEATGLCSHRCLSKTSEYIMTGLKARGLPFVTINLPDCGKFLERSLESGSISIERPIYHGRLLRARDARPAFLHSLWAMLFDCDGQLLSNPSPEAVFWLRQVYNLFKKLTMPCAQEYVDHSVEEYIRIENELPRSHPDTWDANVPVWLSRYGHPLWGTHGSDTCWYDTREDSHDWELFRFVCGYLSSSLGYLDPWLLRPKHGPGVVAEGKVIKYDFTVWPKKLGLYFPADWFASTDLQDRSKSDVEPSSRLIAVPKTQKGPRLIAAEPSAHQWIQGGIQRWFEERVRETPLGRSIDFHRQELSGQLALQASADLLSCTIDLSSASDRLSTRLVEYVFQANHSVLDALHACRTRSLVIPEGLHSSLSRTMILLRKFAPMGSACTFPVQTIVFTAISVYAILHSRGITSATGAIIDSVLKEVRVFGDDIIVPTAAFDVLSDALTSLGLRVNLSKSFHSGMFRESCGTDAYAGLDVTPAYIRVCESSNPEALKSLVDSSNNLFKKGLWRTSEALLKTVGGAQRKLLIVASQAFGSLSLFSFCEGVRSSKVRWSKRLHRWEHWGLTITGKPQRLHGSGEGTLLQFFVERGRVAPVLQEVTVNDCEHLVATKWSSGQASRARSRFKSGWVHG
jgi:hypothetical protein